MQDGKRFTEKDESSEIHAKGSERLIGTRLDEYEIERLKKATNKSWLYVATDTHLNRKVALKVLKPGLSAEREVFFKKEGHKLAGLNHPNVVPVYSGGEDRGYKYLAMQLIDTPDLQEIIRSGRKLPRKISLESIMYQVISGTEHCLEQGTSHEDIKPANIMLMPQGSVIMVDFGVRSTRDASSNDCIGIGNVAQALINNSPKRVPRALKDIASHATRGDYSYVQELKNDLKKYTRKRLAKKWLGYVASVTLTGLAIGIGNRHVEYQKSGGYLADRIALTNVNDPRFEVLTDNLKIKLADKVKRVAQTGTYTDSVPFATVRNTGKWFPNDRIDYSTGFWRGILWEASRFTQDRTLEQLARKSTEKSLFAPEDTQGNTAVRLFYSDAEAFNKTGEERYRDEALKGASSLEEQFNDNLGFIKITDEPFAITSTMSDTVPFLWWAYEQTGNVKYANAAQAHAKAISRFNMREDGSVVERAYIDPLTKTSIRGENPAGMTGESTVSRAQAQMIIGLVETYKHTHDIEMLERAKRSTKYFLDQLPPDRVPWYDFKAISSYKTHKDSSAAAMGAYGINMLGEITKDETYRNASREILKSLITQYTSYSNSDEGLLKHGCFNAPYNYYTDSSLVFGDYYFLKALNCMGRKD